MHEVHSHCQMEWDSARRKSKGGLLLQKINGSFVVSMTQDDIAVSVFPKIKFDMSFLLSFGNYESSVRFFLFSEVNASARISYYPRCMLGLCRNFAFLKIKKVHD